MKPPAPQSLVPGRFDRHSGLARWRYARMVMRPKGLLVALLLLCGCQRPPPACVAPPSGMVAWWPGDGNTNDIVGSNPGTLRFGATYGVGLVGGQAFSFDGVNDGVSILKTSVLNMGASDFTIDAWVKFTQIAGPFSPIFVNYAGVPGYILSVNQSGQAKVWFRPGVALTGGSNDPYVEAIGTKILNDGQWHHVAGVRSHATALIYVDGVLEGSGTNPQVLSVNGGSVDTSNCQYARIGAIHTSGGHCTSVDPNPAEPRFQGLIDEVEIFNRALCATDIQAIFNAGAAGKCK